MARGKRFWTEFLCNVRVNFKVFVQERGGKVLVFGMALGLLAFQMDDHIVVQHHAAPKTRDSSLARVTLTFRCLGPDASAVMYGRLTSV